MVHGVIIFSAVLWIDVLFVLVLFVFLRSSMLMTNISTAQHLGF